MAWCSESSIFLFTLQHDIGVFRLYLPAAEYEGNKCLSIHTQICISVQMKSDVLQAVSSGSPWL